MIPTPSLTGGAILRDCHGDCFEIQFQLVMTRLVALLQMGMEMETKAEIRTHVRM